MTAHLGDDVAVELAQTDRVTDGPLALPGWALMSTLCVAKVLEVLVVTVVIVALPVIGADLGLADARLQLVVSLYAVLYGGLLLTAGRVADLVDRRLVLAVPSPGRPPARRPPPARRCWSAGRCRVSAGRS